MKSKIEKWLEIEGIQFLKRVGIKARQTVLDFGCGKGNYSIPAAKIVNKKVLVYALDKNSEKLNQLEERARKENLTNIKIINTSGKIKTNLKDNSIDITLLYDVIHLVGKNDSSTLKDRKRLYKEVYRVSKSTGLVSVYPMHLKTHTDITSKGEVRKEIEEAGFKFEKEAYMELVHDDSKIKGYILNFRKILK